MLKKVGCLFILVFIGTSLGLLYVAGKVESVTLSYGMRSTERNIVDQYDRLKNHKYHLAALKSPSQLTSQMADTKIDLVPVREVRILRSAKHRLPMPKQQVFQLAPSGKTPGFLTVREAQAKTDDSR